MSGRNGQPKKGAEVRLDLDRQAMLRAGVRNEDDKPDDLPQESIGLVHELWITEDVLHLFDGASEERRRVRNIVRAVLRPGTQFSFLTLEIRDFDFYRVCPGPV